MDGDLEQSIRGASEPLSLYDPLRHVPVSELLPIDLNTSEQREGECCHFSIRGYVASVHKSDKKICWPFSQIYGNHNLDNDENILPAISVAQFRWWNCEKCLLNDGTRKNDGLRKFCDEDRARISIPNVNLSAEGDVTVKKHLVSSLPKGSTEPLIQLMPMEVDHKSVDNKGVGKSGGLRAVGTEPLSRSMPVEEVTSVEQCQVGDQDQFDSNGSHSISQFEDAMVTGPHDANAHGDFHTMPSNATIYCEQIPENELSKERGLHSNTPDSCMGVIALRQQHSAPKTDGTRMHELSAGDPHGHSCEVIDKNGVIIENEEDEHIDQSGDGNGTANRRKVRRTRALSDIIKSEVLRVSKKVSLTTESEATCDVKDKQKRPKSKMVPAISADEATYSHANNSANHSGKKDHVKEEGMHTCKKYSKFRTVPAISRDEVIHVNDKNGGKTTNVKNNDKHPCKKHIKSKEILQSSADEATNTDDKDRRKVDCIKGKIKNTCKKHKSIVSSAVCDVKAPVTADKKVGKIDKLNGVTKHVPKELNIAAQDKHKKKNQLKKRLVLPKINDESSSLIEWMKKTSKKIEAFKQNADSKFDDSTELLSLRTVSPSDVVPLRKKDRPFVLGNGMKRSKFKRQKSSVERQQGLLKQRSDITDYSASQSGFEEIDPGNSHQKSTKVSGTTGSLNLKPPSLSRRSEKGTACKPQGEMAPEKDDRPLLISRQKDSDSLLKGKIIEKQTTKKIEHTTETSSVDGIPVEILKLLQENYEKRHSDESINAKTGRDASLIAEDNDASLGPFKQLQEPHEQQRQQECTTRTVQDAILKPHKWQTQLEYTAMTARDSSIKPYPLELELLSPPSKSHQDQACLTLGYQFDSTGKRNKCMGSDYRAIGKCKQWDISAVFPDFSNCRKHASYGLLDSRSNSGNANGFHLQDRDHLWVMNNQNNHVEGRNLSSHDSTGNCNDPRTSISPDTTFLRILDSPTAKDKEVLPNDASAKRKRAINESKCKKILGQKIAQMQKEGVILPHSGPAKEYNAGTVRPSDLRMNETISALNLLKLIDPAVCSTTPVCVSSDKNPGKMSEQSNYAYNYMPKGSFRGSSGERIYEENKNPHYHSVNSNFHSPTPRIGVPIPFYLKDSTVDSPGHKFKASYRPFMGTDNGEACVHIQGNTRNVGNPSTSQNRVSPCYSFLSNGNPEAALNFRSPTNLFCGKMVQARQKDKVGGATEVRKNSCSTELCSVNRNPADFTIPGEDNEYMTGYEDQQLEKLSLLDGREHPAYPENRRKRKALSLLAMKGLLRS